MYDRVLWEWLEWHDTLELAKEHCDQTTKNIGDVDNCYWLIFNTPARGYGVWNQVMNDERLEAWKPNTALVAYRNYYSNEWADR